MRAFFVLLSLLAAPSFAVMPGGLLYVKTKDTPLRKTPDPKGATLVTLQPGKAVVWSGLSAKSKDWHEVSVDGKKGFVHRGDLTPHAPVPEVAASNGGSTNPKSFAESGYVVCSFGPPARETHATPADKEAMAELIYLEELNRQAATAAALDQKHQALQR